MVGLGLAAVVTGLTLQATGSGPQDPPEAVVDEVVVTGMRDRAVERFVDSLTQPGGRGRFSGQVARWGRPVCVGVVGSTAEVGTTLKTAVEDTIRSLDIPTGEAGCATNALVVISGDADVFAQGFADRFRFRLFENRREATDAFAGPSRAVRWHHKIRLVGTGRGASIDTLSGAGGAMGGQLPDTRLRMSTAAHIDAAVVLVDRDRLQYAGTEALVAYLAFVIVLDLPSAPEGIGPDTILNLFGDMTTPAPETLTPRDRAFVRAVYRSRPDQRFSVQQADIAATLRRSRTNTEQTSDQ